MMMKKKKKKIQMLTKITVVQLGMVNLQGNRNEYLFLFLHICIVNRPRVWSE